MEGGRKRSRPSTNHTQSTGGCLSHCPCSNNCRVVAAKRSRSRRTKRATDQNAIIVLDSDDEKTPSDIQKKVDAFFKALGSDDEDTPKQDEKKDKAFYTISTDSEEDMDKNIKENTVSPEVSPLVSSTFCEPSTSGLGNSGNEIVTEIDSEEEPEDFFAYVDKIFKECDSVVIDLTDDNNESFEDLMTKTDDILKSISSHFEKIEQSGKAPTPQQEERACPICLEEFADIKPPVVTQCGHLFCEACILQVLQQQGECPSCRQPLIKSTNQAYHPVFL